jgi:hypothetical protein
MTELEFKDAYVLANKDLIEAEWGQLKQKEKSDEEQSAEDNEGDTSAGEESVYDKSSEEEEMNKIAKRRRRKKSKQILEKPQKRAKQMDLSGLILPKSGDKTVAGEAFGKLSSSQQKVVAENINKKTKKV